MSGPPSTKIKNKWSYTSFPPTRLYVRGRDFNFAFYLHNTTTGSFDILPSYFQTAIAIRDAIQTASLTEYSGTSTNTHFRCFVLFLLCDGGNPTQYPHKLHAGVVSVRTRASVAHRFLN